MLDGILHESAGRFRGVQCGVPRRRTKLGEIVRVSGRFSFLRGIKSPLASKTGCRVSSQLSPLKKSLVILVGMLPPHRTGKSTLHRHIAALLKLEKLQRKEEQNKVYTDSDEKSKKLVHAF